MNTKSILAGIALKAMNLLNAQSWTVVGDPAMNGPIYTSTVDTTNKLYVAGNFSYGITQNGKSYLARYNYMDWEDVGNFGGNGMIEKIISDAGNNLYISAEFKNVTNQYYIAKYDGSSWSQLGSLASQNKISDIVTDGTHVYASGIFVNTGTGRLITSQNGTEATGINSAEIYDTSGKLVKKLSLDAASAETNLTGHPKGVYLLKTDTGKKQETQKVILK